MWKKSYNSVDNCVIKKNKKLFAGILLTAILIIVARALRLMINDMESLALATLLIYLRGVIHLSLALRADGEKEKALEAFEEFQAFIDSREIYTEPYFDHNLASVHLKRLLK